MYSQKAEESYILRAVAGMTGRFLDIGAYDGVSYSNTMALVDLDWEGVMVEPGLEAFQQLLKNHGDNPRIALVHGAAADGSRLTKFWDNPKTFSTTEESNRERFIHEGFSRPFYVPTVSMEELLLRFGPYDVVSLDTEGTSRTLLALVLLICAGSLPKVICVEHDGYVTECRRLAEERGYTTIMENEENLIFERVG